MEKGKEYLIPVSGLAIGKHSYHYVIDDAFFARYDYSEVKHGKVELDLNVEREESMMTLSFDFKGEVMVPCDRCVDDFYIPINGCNVFLIKTGVEQPSGEEDDEVAYVPADQGSFDVSELIYEYLILSIPMHRVHPEGQCNPKVMALLNQGAEADEENGSIDPRWEALKNLNLEEENKENK